jgi:hypothetical protein
MGKVNEKVFIGQPVYAQILSLINRVEFNRLVAKFNADRYYKNFKSWTHFVTLMYGILSRCNSINEIYEGLVGCVGKLGHFGLMEVPAKSTITDGNRERKSDFFEALYISLVTRYGHYLSSSQNISKKVKKLFIIDSTTIQLFCDMIFKGVGRNRKDNGKKKGGLKVHMLIDAMEGYAQFVKITAARMHDRKFLHELTIQPFSMLVFDKAYNVYQLFARWTEQNVWFVTRMKDNAIYEVIETIKITLKQKQEGILSEQHILLSYKEGKETKTVKLRRICYKDEKGRKYVFITNNFEITAKEVADIYKRRWQIELLFKKIKQNFQLRYFYGESENAIRIQIWCTLIAQLLLTVLHSKTKTKKAFSNVACIVRQHLLSYFNIEELLKNVQRFYDKHRKQNDYSNTLFPNYNGGLGFG